MTEYVHTPTGSRIAFDRYGAGPTVIFVAGALQYRDLDEETAATAADLASRGCSAIYYDRPGRGESDRLADYSLEGECDAIAALIDDATAPVTLFGSSSGGAIALAAASRDRRVENLVVWEVPLGPENCPEGGQFLDSLREVISTGTGEDVVRFFMSGMPPEWFDGYRASDAWPQIEQHAPTLAADAQALAWTQSAPRAQLWAQIHANTIAVIGEGAFPFFADAADSIANAVNGARRVEIPGSGHGWNPTDLAAAIAHHIHTPNTRPETGGMT